MFIGHYGVSFAAKPAHKSVPLWVLFVAVQWLDVVWSCLVMLDIEKVRIVKGFTGGSPLDLYYMPYSHGLPGALALSMIYGAFTTLFVRTRKNVAFAIGAAAAFSHWLLDLVVHVRDLPLLGNSMKVGFGLWRYPLISLPLELAILVFGVLLYARAVPSKTRFGDAMLWVFVTAMTLAEFYGAFGPDPASPAAAAQTALIAYGAIAVLAGLVDWARGTVNGEAARLEDPNPLSDKPFPA